MKKLCVFGLILLFGVVSLAAVVAGGTEEPKKTAEAGIEEIKAGVASLPPSLDPNAEASNTGIRVLLNVYETLIYADPKDNFKLKPMLATSWKRVSDTVLELKLRQGVRWHNGDEFNAEDVKFTMARIKNTKEPFAAARALLDNVDRAEVVDSHTVRVITKAPDPALEARLASTWGSWIVPYQYTKDMNSEQFSLAPVGSGPYKIAESTPDKLVLERFDDYWGDAPLAKRLVYRLIPETAARMTAVINGEVDVIAQIPPDQIATLEKYKDVTVSGCNLVNMHMLVYNTAYGPLRDMKLRQAMNLAIDRKLLVDTLWHGRAIVPRGHQYPAFRDLYFGDRPFLEYNPEKAKKLVAESSYTGEEIPFETQPAYYTFGAQAAEAIVDMWKAVGINAKVVFVERHKRQYASNWSNTMRLPDPAGGLRLMWGSKSWIRKGNATAEPTWLDASDEFIQLSDELQSIMNFDRRKVITEKLMDLWEEEAPGTALYYPWESWAHRKGLKWEPYPNQAMDFRAGNLSIDK